MTQETIQLIEDNMDIFDTIRVGYAKNIHPSILEKFEYAYQQEFDKTFALSIWCGGCVFSMLNTFLVQYDKYKEHSSDIKDEPVILEKRRGRKPKDESTH